MYCVNCGVKLGDAEQKCPLCQTVVFHPDIVRGKAEPLYPPEQEEAPQVNASVAQIIIITAHLLALLIGVMCDLQINGMITWAGYLVGALLLSYVIIFLPLWFRRPNPVVLVPCDFAAVGLYLLYISIATDGRWFLSFAFPVTGFVGLLVTAVVTLLRYVRRGRLYVFGGAVALLGVFMPLMEFLLCITFSHLSFLGWSFYPLIALVLLGGMLIFLAICRPARQTMQQKFFI